MQHMRVPRDVCDTFKDEIEPGIQLMNRVSRLGFSVW